MPMRSRVIRRFVGWAMGALLVVSVLVWWVTRDTLPREITIATAEPGGLYHKLATALAEPLERATGRPVTVVRTRGSRENREQLLSGDVQVAILQSGAMSMDGLVAIAPLYEDVVHVIARRGRGIHEVTDLAGRTISIGLEGSGMRVSSLEVLRHYRVDPASLSGTDRYFDELLADESLDGAIVTTGLLNPDLEAVLGSGDFDVIPILDAAAIAIHHPAYSPTVIPRGLYAEGPAIPPADVQTIATMAILAGRDDVSTQLVQATLKALYGTDLSGDVPTLFSAAEARAWSRLHLHSATRRYFDPYGGIDILASFMESVAAAKELLFALAAGLYLAWDRWRRVREREREREMRVLKDRLDAFLDETVRIERAQMTTTDPARLQEYLDEVTQVKLKALDELTHEDLRGDRMFHIFLTQCGNLMNKIQAKIQITLSHPDRPAGSG